MEEINPTKIYCKHICKYHNVASCINYYILIFFNVAFSMSKMGTLGVVLGKTM
jgi:hypothetical protein